MPTTAHPSLADVQAASRRLAGGLRLTPCLIAPALSETLGIELRLKRDDLQRTGSFKERGARHALLQLPAAQHPPGVVTASAGNHALGLAYHGTTLGIKVTVVMPETAPVIKIKRCRGFGSQLILHGASYEAAEAYARKLAADRQARFVHPFDDADVIAGQGTMALEILAQAPELDTLLVPVGGGGLLAGVVVVVKALRPDVRVIAVEPERAASFHHAHQLGRPDAVPVGPTLADGLAVARTGRLPFAVATRVDAFVTVSEEEIAAAISLLATKAGIVAEGAGAVPLAAVLAGKVKASPRMVLPIGGRNIDRAVHERAVGVGKAWLGRMQSARPRDEARPAAQHARATRRQGAPATTENPHLCRHHPARHR